MVSQTRCNYFAATIFVQADGSVLRRLNAIPDRYMFSPNYTDHVNNGSAYSELTGRDDFTLGSLRLDSLEVSIYFCGLGTAPARYDDTIFAFRGKSRTLKVRRCSTRRVPFSAGRYKCCSPLFTLTSRWPWSPSTSPLFPATSRTGNTTSSLCTSIASRVQRGTSACGRWTLRHAPPQGWSCVANIVPRLREHR